MRSEIEVLICMCWFAKYCCTKLAIWSTFNQHIEERDFVVSFLFHSEFNVVVNIIDVSVEVLNLIFLDNDKRIVNITSPKSNMMGEGR